MLFKQLLVTSTRVHILALTSSFASTTLTTLTLDLATSAPQADLTQIPSIVSLPSSALLTSSSTSGAARVIWLEHGRIRNAYLAENGLLGDTKDLMPGQGHVYSSIREVGLRRQGWILGTKENGAVQILEVSNGGRIVEEFEGSVRYNLWSVGLKI
jgi:hypothetical protein